MSSFDDAIRQHLDLKRRRGADLRVVAELEREALGLSSGGLLSADDVGHRRPPGVPSHIRRRSRFDQETIDRETMEIDMRAVIGGDEVEPEFYARDNREAYDWSVDGVDADISDPASVFEWETPYRARLRGAA